MKHRLLLASTGTLSGIGALLLGACGGGSSGANAGAFEIVEASNGFGKLLPYSIAVPDQNGQPTDEVVEIDSLDDLLANLRPENGVQPPVKWKASAELPNAAPGNHFIYVRFNQPIDVDSVLTSAASSTVDQNLVGNIQVVQVEQDGTTTPIPGRGFVGGRTYGSPDPANPGQLLLEDWVRLEDGKPTAQNINGSFPGLGYPGTQANFSGAAQLVSPNVFVFVVDSDQDMAGTHEMFPQGVQLQLKITRGVLNGKGRALEQEGVASSTVGDDDLPPAVLEAAEVPVIIPNDGELGVDPEANIEVFFTEPIQFLTIGDLEDGTTPRLSAAIQLQFGPDQSKVDVPYTVRPFSVYDLTHLELNPVYNFPGSGPNVDASCGDFSTVDIIVNEFQFQDLAGNFNSEGIRSSFQTAEGPGLVNAPVIPDVVYLARGGSTPGISVIDLNGFGKGTGNPTFDPENPIVEGNTNAPNNPNERIQGNILVPPLVPGTCTVDGGSEGPFSLTKDSSLNDLLASSPILDSVGDMQIGHPLDNTFNNGAPFGCQAGGGNLCAQTGLKTTAIAAAGSVVLVPPSAVPGATPFSLKTEFGAENLASWAPHPNPPPLVFPPLCLSPLIGAQEPTSIDVSGIPNLLVPSPNSLGFPELGVPPEGILSVEQNAFFIGPSAPQTNIQACVNYSIRQQIGHFLYVVDRARSEIVVLNSNRFTVIDRIRTPDPTTLAMSPNLDLLVVTNEGADQISFIDTEPRSSTFHQIVKTTVVGNGPTGVSWTPDNEDILVCNTADGTVSIVSAFNFEVRKVVRNQLRSPFEIVLTPRVNGFAFQSQLYYGYILNLDGSVALFESGPDGVNGWGFDDVVGTLPFQFDNPRAIALDPGSITLQFFVAHENRLDLQTGLKTGERGGAITGLQVRSATVGRIPLDPILSTVPNLRDIQFSVFMAAGSQQLTGVPIDIGFDSLRNRTALHNITNFFSAARPGISLNGKAIMRTGAQVTAVPQYLFAAVPNSREGPGVVDVLNWASGFQRVDTNPFRPGVQSIPAPNVTKVIDYLRQ